MNRILPVLRLVAGAVLLGFLLWRFGTGPFADAWQLTTVGSVSAALALTAMATLANAWRWRMVARALGVPLSPAWSLAAYYRSQFLNATLPGGILGDAHRGLRHGRDAGDLGAGLRATGWDRVAGQLVQGTLLMTALLVLPTPLRAYAPLAVAAAAVVVVVGWSAWRSGRTGFVGDDLRVLLRASLCVRVAVASFVSTAGHLAVFWVALAAVGVDVSPASALVIGLVVLTGSAVPLSIAGWGAREGVTSAVFAVVGLGSATGLTVSVVFGVLSAVATLPGALVLVADAVVRRRGRRPEPVSARVLEEARHG
jgi:glycosyltransferase 2 family protein